MAISTAEVNKIAKLSRLTFNEDEIQKLQHELSSILDYVDQLKQIESKSALELDVDTDAVNLMRDDVAEELTPPEEFLKQTPERQGKFIKVKSVLE
jgi:aspartyl-tRNA(Asn)/glutamyl-tRNA(Gln) amidotransferase subunit C